MTPEFRAWDKKTKKMYFVNAIEMKPNNDITVWTNHFEGGYRLTDDYILEQNTGLKDKNDTKIFEADIVKVTFEDGSGVATSIKWFGNEGYPAFDLEDIFGRWFDTSNALSTIIESGVETVEVIGNIHENPELLEVQDD